MSKSFSLYVQKQFVLFFVYLRAFDLYLPCLSCRIFWFCFIRTLVEVTFCMLIFLSDSVEYKKILLWRQGKHYAIEFVNNLTSIFLPFFVSNSINFCFLKPKVNGCCDFWRCCNFGLFKSKEDESFFRGGDDFRRFES